MNVTLYNLLYMVRQAVQEAFSKESIYNPDRTDFINALQGILEKCESSRSDMIELDFEDLHILHKNRAVLNDAAHIHEAFMGNAALAGALRQIAGNIATAQKNLWLPTAA